MATILQLKDAKRKLFRKSELGVLSMMPQTQANRFICLLNHAHQAPLANIKNGMPKVARKAFNIGEVWNPVCCHGNRTVVFILWSTVTGSRILLQRIKHFWYKLAEISFFIFDQNLVEYIIPTNFSKVKCVRFSILTPRQFPKISDVSKDNQRVPEIQSEHCRRWSHFRSYQLFWQIDYWIYI